MKDIESSVCRERSETGRLMHCDIPFKNHDIILHILSGSGNDFINDLS